MAENPLREAAHVGHPIAHSYADLGGFLGGALGLVAGIAIVVLGAGTPLAIAAGCAVAKGGNWLGEQIGEAAGTDETSGAIARGSPNVHYGPQMMKAARMNDRTACESPGMAFMETIAPFNPITGILGAVRGLDRSITVVGMWWRGEEILDTDMGMGAHAGSKIADGSSTVFINTWPAARKGDGVHPCDGKISDGIDSILIGGAQCQMQDTEDRNESSRGQRVLFQVVDAVGNLAGGLRDPGTYIWAASFLGEQLGIDWLKTTGDTLGFVNGLNGLRNADLTTLQRTAGIATQPIAAAQLGEQWGNQLRQEPPRRVFDPETRTVRLVPAG